MPYMEPGAYSRVNEVRNTGTGTTPALIPLITGSGATVLTRTEVITRASGLIDTLPTVAQSIKLIGYTANKADFAVTTDYTFTPGTSGSDKINWTETGKSPAPGEKYTVIYTCNVDNTQYQPRLVYTLDDIKKYYGTDIKTEEGTKADVNPIALGLRIALAAGISPVHALQIAPATAGSAVDAADYQSALDTYAKFVSTIWRIVPMDLDDAINAVIDNHVRFCSTFDERLERTAIYGKSHSDFSTFNDLNTAIGGYASSKSNRRIIVPYPDQATMLLDDGIYHTLGAPFIAAAIAGLQAAMPVQQSLTRARIGIFNELKGFNMTRTQKNTLAANGVMVLEQPFGPGTDIIIRHGLTTDMSSVQAKENSILAVEDFCAKYLRSIADKYIGQYNITPDTISRIKGSLSTAIAQLINDGVIVDGKVQSLAQDVDNPDTLLISVRIQPPYPCNYINITLYVD
jgi:hypothetical protein